MTSQDTFSKVKQLRKLTQPLSILIHHLERADARASWLIPLFNGFLVDVDEWCKPQPNPVRLYFHFDNTFNMVKRAITKRWNGDPPLQAGLYNDQYLMATIVDPTFSRALVDLPEGWLNACRNVLMRFYQNDELTEAEGELLRLVDRQGQWGSEVALQQDRLRLHLNSGGMFVVQNIAAAQVATSSDKPHLRWKMLFGRQFPLLFEIARRVLIMGTQSADVERVCKAHKVIHTKVRNRLKNKTVYNLLFCYVNLRLLGKINEDDTMSNFLEQAILDNMSTDEEVAVEVEEPRED